jgi:hypothetical protein
MPLPKRPTDNPGSGKHPEVLSLWARGKRQLLVRRWAVQAAWLQPAEVDVERIGEYYYPDFLFLQQTLKLTIFDKGASQFVSDRDT